MTINADAPLGRGRSESDASDTSVAKSSTTLMPAREADRLAQAWLAALPEAVVELMPLPSVEQLIHSLPEAERTYWDIDRIGREYGDTRQLPGP